MARLRPARFSPPIAQSLKPIVEHSLHSWHITSMLKSKSIPAAEQSLGLRERNKIDKQRRIREAARELFIAKGFDDATTREIAVRAGVGIASQTTGAMPAAFGTADEVTLKAAAAAEPGTDGTDLVAEVTCAEPFTVGDGPRRVVAYDLGIKATILHHLGQRATVEVVPATTSAAEVLARRPDGVFLSNGPGDPAAVTGTTEAIRGLLGEVPVFGICLGHQLLATALGGETYKLPFGHHGGNHPVRRLDTGAVEITSQNHNYAVAEGSLSTADVSHVNLNDGVVEGIRCRDVPAFSVQYHPEAGPGPHDSRYLFDLFDQLMAEGGPR